MHSVYQHLNFLGIQSTLDKAKCVILPIPYEVTTSNKRGTKYGPSAIIEASDELELFDIELGDNISSYVGIYTAPPLIPGLSPDNAMEKIKKEVLSYIRTNKFVVCLGGEHTISLSCVSAYLSQHDQKHVSILHLDAHADLRDEFDGIRLSHACVMRRISELFPYINVVHIGIRSMSEDEYMYIKKENGDKQKVKKHTIIPNYLIDPSHSDTNTLVKMIKMLRKNVYITIDMDVFDPSEVPAVGNPCPGGLRWNNMLSILREVYKNRNVIGCDVVELSPLPHDSRSEILAAGLVYKLIGYKFIDHRL